MSTTITGTPGTAIAATCTGPSAGADVLAGDVNGPLTSIENDIATLAKVWGATATRVAQGLILVSDGTVGFPSTASPYGVPSVPAAGASMQPIDVLPHGSTVTTLVVRLIPAAHGSIVGLTLPVVTLYASHKTTGALTAIGSQPDTSGSAGAYSAAHDVTISGMSHTVDASTYYYYMDIQWEFGGAFAAAGSHLAARVTFATPTNPTVY